MARVDAPLIRHAAKKWGLAKADMLAETPLFDLGRLGGPEQYISRFRFNVAKARGMRGELTLPFPAVATHSSVDARPGVVIHFASIVVDIETAGAYWQLLGNHPDIAEEMPEEDCYLFFAWSWINRDAPTVGVAGWLKRDWTGGPQAQVIAAYGGMASEFDEQVVIAQSQTDLMVLSSLMERHHLAIGERKANRRERKAAKFRPWNRVDTPRVVFLDEGCTRDVTGQPVRGPSTPSADTVGEGKVIMAHRRRAHKRVLRSERWGDRQGDVVWVKAAWVGPREWAHGGVQYRIVDNRNG